MGTCTAPYKKLLFCAKTIVTDSHNFELHVACMMEEVGNRFWPFGNFLV